MTRFIPSLIFLFGFIVMLNSQTYYIKYDPGCFDRYEFVTDIDKTPYVVYTAKTMDGKMVQMDIGKEPVKWVKNLPGQLTSCSALSYDKAMVLAINNSNAKLYVVRESPTHYNISPVEKATYLSSTGSNFEVTMGDADFTLDWDKMYSNRNLATPASTKMKEQENVRMKMFENKVYAMGSQLGPTGRQQQKVRTLNHRRNLQQNNDEVGSIGGEKDGSWTCLRTQGITLI